MTDREQQRERERKLMCSFASYLASTGQAFEFIAQFIASTLVCDLSLGEALDLKEYIDHAVNLLVNNQGLIWSELLPGGPGDAESLQLIEAIEDLAASQPADDGTVEVVVVAITSDNWIVADKSMTLYAWRPVEFTNVSNPDADATEPGDICLVPAADFTAGDIRPVDFSEVHHYLN